jgi:tRNA(Ile)-lysidine synthase
VKPIETQIGPGSDPVHVARRFGERVRAKGWLSPGDRVVVAVSGGLDSTVLLHLLRFARGLPDLELVVAHFDHAMRPDSGKDCAWVRGLARGWGLDFVDARSPSPSRSEARAREERYAFLDFVRVEVGARWIVTAHHADDQAETVLHRIVRGTGPAGLSGILEVRSPGVLRPLLPFHRHELEVYARSRRLAHRPDPSNTDRAFARNTLRLDVLPKIEASVATRARRSLARLARLAASEEEAFRSLLSGVESEVVVGREGGRVSVDRDALLAHHTGVRARILRKLASDFGIGLDEAGTEALLAFSESGRSGVTWSGPAGLVVTREFDRMVFSLGLDPPRDAHLEIDDAEAGSGEIVLGGRRLTVTWSTGGSVEGSWTESFGVHGFRLPARFRAWTPGDRIRLPYGSKKLKKLFAEARVPVLERERTPVFVDRHDRVLWVPGLGRSTWAPPDDGEVVLNVAVQEDA